MKKINIFFLVFILLFNHSIAEQNDNFNEWKKSFKGLALAKNISEDTFNQVMKNVKFLPSVIKYDRYQPEFYEDTKTYISKRTSKNKVKKGLSFYKQNNNLINKVEKKFQI